MNFYCLTLFPELIQGCFNSSITGRAVKNGKLNLECINIRDFSDDKHGKVDDYTYGGGAGLLMQAEPVFKAYEAVKNKVGKPMRVLFMSPQGRTFNQEMAIELSKEENLVFLCGHYEGIDERVISEIVTDEVSLGDFVLTGGELPAVVMMDAIARMVPGVLHNEVSGETDSFYNGLLEYPQYTRPEEWHGVKVPEVLLSGAHDPVDNWRMQESLKRTREKRPDLYKAYRQEHPYEPSRNKVMHISFDDVFECLLELSEKGDSYNSIFDVPLFKILKKFHEKYGAVFSLYCFYEFPNMGEKCLDSLEICDKFKIEFAENSSWLRLGSHDLHNYDKCVTTLRNLVGETSIDTFPRIHTYAGTLYECKKARALGALGFLDADDDRLSYYHTEAERTELLKKRVLYDIENDIFFVRTDVRFEKCEDVWETLKPFARDKVNRALTLFTHEYCLDKGMWEKIETALKWGVKNNYTFEFPMDYVR